MSVCVYVVGGWWRQSWRCVWDSEQ